MLSIIASHAMAVISSARDATMKRPCPTAALKNKSSARIRFHQVRAGALALAEELVPRWLPRGRRMGSEWVALNPTRADGRPGSFKINLRSGRWADFATGDAGGDLISLRAYLEGI